MNKKGILAQLDSVNEFEREPIPESKLKGLKSFIGMYAGEHTAGTEFVIGPLFVAHGVTAFDLVAGLLIGNLLAVLSWAFLCAPIAVKARMTMYFQLEKICGSNLVKLYNVVNGVMFCFLAGSMIELEFLYQFLDILLATIVLPNMIGLVLMSGQVKEMKDEFLKSVR